MRQEASPFVAMVVLTWNQRALTLDCLESLGGMNYPSERLQIIVVDNGSKDGTAEAIREQYPTVTVKENRENLGFAEGNNVGLRQALDGPADYVMLLNNDTVVDTEMLAALISVAEKDDHIGVVTPKIYYFDEPTRIWCAGASIDWRIGGSTRLRAEEMDNGEPEDPHHVDFASGCAMCWKREVIEEIGLIDPRFFIYYEESDWCVRAAKRGWQIVYVPDSIVWHRISSAMGPASPATDYYMSRNVLLFLKKNLKGVQRVATLARVGGRNLLTVAAYTVKSESGTRRANRDARLLALRDALLGRWNKMGEDVAAVCYPERR